MSYTLVALIVLIGLVLFLIWKVIQKPEREDNSSANSLLLQHLSDLSKTLDSKLGEGNRNMTDFMNTQSSQSQQLMTTITKQVSDQLLEVVKGVSETRESTKQVFTIAEQLNNLEK